MKVNISISVEAEVLSKAREMQLNISHECNEALRNRTRQSINEPDELRLCHYCNKPDLNMIWDGFLEFWVCGKCNRTEIKKVSILAVI